MSLFSVFCVMFHEFSGITSDFITSQYFYIPFHKVYSESTFIRWYQFSWFLQNALIHGFLNSWFQTLQTTVIGENCILLDFNICSLSEPRNLRKLKPLD